MPCTLSEAKIRGMNANNFRRQRPGLLAPAVVIAGLVCAAASLARGQALPSGNRSRNFSPDICGPADPAYIRSANETGGIPLFLQRSEAVKAMQLMRELTRNNVSTVFWATGTAYGAPQVIIVPIDSVSQRLTFTFSTDTKGTQFKLTLPSGGVITSPCQRMLSVLYVASVSTNEPRS